MSAAQLRFYLDSLGLLSNFDLNLYIYSFKENACKNLRCRLCFEVDTLDTTAGAGRLQ